MAIWEFPGPDSSIPAIAVIRPNGAPAWPSVRIPEHPLESVPSCSLLSWQLPALLLAADLAAASLLHDMKVFLTDTRASGLDESAGQPPQQRPGDLRLECAVWIGFCATAWPSALQRWCVRATGFAWALSLTARERAQFPPVARVRFVLQEDLNGEDGLGATVERYRRFPERRGEGGVSIGNGVRLEICNEFTK
jgi:hypothetical protein